MKDSGFESDSSVKTNDISIISTDSNQKNKLINKIEDIEGGLGLNFLDKKDKKKNKSFRTNLKEYKF